MFGVREAVKTKFEIDERLRSSPRDPAPWRVLEAVLLVAGMVFLMAVVY